MPFVGRSADPDLVCMIDADSGEALLPLSEFAPLVAEVVTLRAERDLLRARLEQIKAIAAGSAPRTPVAADRSLAAG